MYRPRTVDNLFLCLIAAFRREGCAHTAESDGRGMKVVNLHEIINRLFVRETIICALDDDNAQGTDNDTVIPSILPLNYCMITWRSRFDLVVLLLLHVAASAARGCQLCNHRGESHRSGNGSKGNAKLSNKLAICVIIR
jgi:hypothetical protein